MDIISQQIGCVGIEWINLAQDDVQRLNAGLNPICHLLAILGAHPILHVSRIRVKKQQKRFSVFVTGWLFLDEQGYC